MDKEFSMALSHNPYLPLWEHIPDGEPRVFGDRLYVFGSHDLENGHEFCEQDYVTWSTPCDDLSKWRYGSFIGKIRTRIIRIISRSMRRMWCRGRMDAITCITASNFRTAYRLPLRIGRLVRMRFWEASVIRMEGACRRTSRMIRQYWLTKGTYICISALRPA